MLTSILKHILQYKLCLLLLYETPLFLTANSSFVMLIILLMEIGQILSTIQLVKNCNREE